MATNTDWEAIETDYRVGIVSLREIGRIHGVSDTAIRKRAKAEGWVRDLTEKVRERTRDKVVRDIGSRGGSQEQRVQTDAEAIEAASDTQASVLRSHRNDIATGRRIIATLFNELTEATDHRHAIDEAIEVETASDRNGQRAAMMRRAVALPGRASTMQSLAGALKNIVALERQAFNIDIPGGDEPATKSDVAKVAASMSRADRDELRSMLRRASS